MQSRLLCIGASLVIALSGLPASAQSSTADRDFVVENAWTRATGDVGGSAEIFFTLHNTSEKIIDLIGVRADVASIETLHKSLAGASGKVRMSAVPELRLAPGASAQLEPGSYHVMLIDLEKPLVEGGTLRLRLKFYDGDDVIVEVPILAADATGPQTSATADASSSD